MVEVFVAGGGGYFLLQLVDGAGCGDGADVATVRADEKILMAAGDEQSEVSCTLMQAEAAHDAFVRELLQEAEDCGSVAESFEIRVLSQRRECHR